MNFYLKFIFTFLGFHSVFLITNSFSQAPAIQWQKCFGGSDNDEAHSVIQTADGGYITAGSTASNNGDVTGFHGYFDYWVVKLDSSGAIQWQKSLGGTGDDEAASIIQCMDGGYVVAGFTYSNDGDVMGNHGASDYWIVKLDSYGNIQWQKSLGGSTYDMANSIMQTADGYYTIAGSSLSKDGDVTSNHTGFDYWIVRLDTSGNIQWQKSFGGSSDEEAHSIISTHDGGYIVSGYSFSNDGDVSGNHGFLDYWIIKLDSAANIEWQKTLGGTHLDQAYSIIQANDYGYIVAGFSYSDDGDITSHLGTTTFNDYWIVKIDSSGILQWEKSYGGTRWDYGAAICKTLNNRFAVAGWSNSADINVSGNIGNSYDYWIVEFDSTGNLIWEKSLGGYDIEDALSINITNDNGFVIGGFTLSDSVNVSGNHGLRDYWIVKLGPDTSTGISNSEVTNYTLNISPNPFTNEFTVSYCHRNLFPEELKMFDIFGKEILSQQIKSETLTVQTKYLSPGIYFIKIGSVTKKIIKTN